jgi:hypothetical protein
MRPYEIYSIYAFFPLILVGEEGKTRFELPITRGSFPRYELEATIPEGYISLQKFEEWEKGDIIEFVPQGEDGENWSEIITINKLIGRKVFAPTFLTLLKIQMLATLNNGQVLQESSDQLEHYSLATLILSYDFERRHEIFGVQYYSGLYEPIPIISSDDL